MPEGDTVWLAAKRMNDALGGRVLTRADLRVPALATVDLTGREVREVLARGKHMLTRLEGELTLHTHFRMDGTWHLGRPGSRWHGGPAYQVRAVLANPEWEAVGYRLHDMKLVATGSEDQVVGHLGPDVLGPDWDPAAVAKRIESEPDTAIGELLLDQTVLAGVGNLYKGETLFLTGLSPWTPVRDVPDVPKVLATAYRLMRANRDHPEQSTTGSMRRDETHWVYGRGKRPCRRCGTTIRVSEQGPAEKAEQARVTYWCPSCQPGPTP